MSAEIIKLFPEEETYKEYIHACECGCVKFNLVSDGTIECHECGRENFYWINE